MIGHYVIVAVFLVYLHSINAQSTYITNPAELKRELFEEINFVARKKREDPYDTKIHDYVCDGLRPQSKKLLCDEIMVHLINEEKKGEFASFEDAGVTLPIRPGTTFAVPRLIDPTNPFKCQEIIENMYSTPKRMYWCMSRKYKTKTGRQDRMPGFYCGGVLTHEKRAYVFRQQYASSDAVDLLGEIIDVDYYAPPDNSISARVARAIGF